MYTFLFSKALSYLFYAEVINNYTTQVGLRSPNSVVNVLKVKLWSFSTDRAYIINCGGELQNFLPGLNIFCERIVAFFRKQGNFVK